ncbi:cytochrome p450 domain-containing protein [Phthorimaea operculella]|nr:cytochrome p450 domain-containing protein [Phthorimaea operculella]
MIWQIFLALLIVRFLWVLWHRRPLYQISRQLDCGLRSWPLIGHALWFWGDDVHRMETLQMIGKVAIKQGGMTATWLGTRLFIITADPVTVELTLKNFLEKDDVVRFSRYITGNGSIFAPVSIWRHRRKTLAPTFTHRNLVEYVRIFAKQSDVLVDKLKDRVGAGPFSIWSYLTTYTMDAVCETTLGIKLHAQENPNQPFLKAFEDYCDLAISRTFQPWLYPDFIYKMHPESKAYTAVRDCLNGFIKEIIKSKRKEVEDNLESKNEYYKTFLDLLMTGGGEKTFTDLELQEESLVVAMAGTDTSAVGKAFVAVMLSWHQDVQEKVYRELQEVFGDSDRRIEPDDLPRLKYLEAVIKETFRLYPPAPITLRKVTSDLTYPSGVTLVKGCSVVINIWALHRNPEYWGPDVNQFRPERFLEAELKHPAQFAAFSFGARNCIGYQYAMMSAKTVLASILRHYRILPAYPPILLSAGRPVYRPLRLKFGIMMKDVDNYMVKLEPRY